VQTLLLLLSLVFAAGPPASAPGDREGFITADDGARLFYRIEGAGAETLVVVHGGPGNSMESIRLDLTPLARGRRVIYYDQRGNGRSELVELARVGIDRQIADLEDLRRHFGLERMTLLGNSWGGLLVSAYAAEHPDRVERLVLDAPAPPTLAGLDALNDEFERRAQLLFSEDERNRISSGLENWRSADDPVAHCRYVMDVCAGSAKRYAGSDR
jgi:proline iminopeptidase